MLVRRARHESGQIQTCQTRAQRKLIKTQNVQKFSNSVHNKDQLTASEYSKHVEIYQVNIVK